MNNPLKLNLEEVALGASFGLALWPFCGLWAMILAIICAFLWSLGGSGAGRKWRFVGVPIVAGIALWHLAQNIQHVNWLAGMTLAALGTLTIGYGTPDASDEGSNLGKFVVNRLKMKDPQATYVIRGFLSVLLAVSYSPLALLLPWHYAGFCATLLVLQHLSVRFVEGEFVL